MEELVDARGQIHRELIGPVATVGGQRVQPVARMDGWARGSGAGIDVTPVKVIVFDAGGAERTVPIYDTGRTVAAMAQVGIAVAVVCGLIMLLRKLFC